MKKKNTTARSAKVGHASAKSCLIPTVPWEKAKKNFGVYPAYDSGYSDGLFQPTPSTSALRFWR